MTLEQTQNVIADDSFVYMGNSLEIIDIVNAIKSGKRLIDIEGLKEEINDYWQTCDNDAKQERCIKCNKTLFSEIIGMIYGEML